MDYDRLKEFLCIAENGSFKAAAKELGIAPSVLSGRCRSFEQSLGTTLFLRNAHTCELTESGQALMLSAKDLLDSYQRMLSSMQDVRGKAFQSLRIMLSSQMMASELGPFLDLYCRRYPGLFLGLYDESNCPIREGLHSGQLDLAFAIGRVDDFQEIPGRIVLQTFSRMKVHLPLDHPLARAHAVSFQELSGETFILYPQMKEQHTRNLQLSMLEQAKISFQIYEEDYSPFFYDLLVPMGKGIRLWNWSDRLAPNTVLLPIRDKGYETSLFMLYDPEREKPAVREFIEGFLAFRKEGR